MHICKFPQQFLWGAATSAYQIEGSVFADGRGESIWDRFVQQTGAVHNNASGETACDHYRLWRDDIALMRDLGLHSHRFSVAWPRVFPSGAAGRPNAAGLAFYDRLVDGLLEAGIQPLATLYHWDLPAALQDAGGWANRDTALRFRDYSAHVFERLGDRVRLWLTINEPWVAAMVGHAFGVHAPGIKDGATAVRAAHHLLLAHGLAVEAFDDLGLRNPGKAGRGETAGGLAGIGRIGLSLDIHAYSPRSHAELDQEATERARTLEARWFLEALFNGQYPEEGLDWYARQGAAPPLEPGDMERIARPLDIVGINYYRRHVVQADGTAPLFEFRHEPPAGRPVTEMGWEVYPEGLYEVLRWVWDTYVAPDEDQAAAGRGGAARSAVRRPSLLVTENGAAYPDTVITENETPRVADDERRAYLQSHLYQVWRAIEDGIPVDGYYAWSLMDNFEWAYGYSKRFGLVYVDFDTQQRIVKDSGRWYADVARDNVLRMDTT